MVLSSRSLPVARSARRPRLTMRYRVLRRDLKTYQPGPSAPVPSPTVRGAAPKDSTSTWTAVVRMAQDLDYPIRQLPGFSAMNLNPDGSRSSRLPGNAQESQKAFFSPPLSHKVLHRFPRWRDSSQQACGRNSWRLVYLAALPALSDTARWTSRHATRCNLGIRVASSLLPCGQPHPPFSLQGSHVSHFRAPHQATNQPHRRRPHGRNVSCGP